MSHAIPEAPRIRPLDPPYSPAIEEHFARIMPPGVPPLALFRVMARDERLYKKFMAGSLLDPGHLSLRQREIVIDRVTARSGSEYEWGVHVAFFARKAALDTTQVAALAHGSSADACWSPEECTLIAICDSLHETCDIAEPLWHRARTHFADAAIMEIVMLAGLYRMVSYLTNALRLPREPFAPTFEQFKPDLPAASAGQ